MYEKIVFSSKGSKMKQKAITERTRLDVQRGVAHRFLQQRIAQNKNTKNENEKDDNSLYEQGMENLLSIMINLISNRQPLSDDMLLACWEYETSKEKYKNNKLECRLWKAIDDAIKQVLKLPLKRIDFVWFKSYLFNSTIWYEEYSKQNINENESKNGNDNESVTTIRKLNDVESDNNNNNNLYCGVCKGSNETFPLEFGMITLLWRKKDPKCFICQTSLSALDHGYACHARIHLYCVECAPVHARKWNKNGEMKSDDDDGDKSAPTRNGNGQNGILYDKLMDVTREHLLIQKSFLEKRILAIKNENWYHEWQEMINFSEYYDDGNGSSPISIGLRQDDTNSLKYPNLPFYSELELKKFGLKHTYETNAYLSDLIVKGSLLFFFTDRGAVRVIFFFVVVGGGFHY